MLSGVNSTHLTASGLVDTGSGDKISAYCGLVASSTSNATVVVRDGSASGPIIASVRVGANRAVIDSCCVAVSGNIHVTVPGSATVDIRWK